MATTAQIDLAFQQAGFSFGRPTEAKFEAAGTVFVFPDSSEALTELFSDSVVEFPTEQGR